MTKPVSRETEIETMFQEMMYHAGPWSYEASDWTLARMRDAGFHGISSEYTGFYLPNGDRPISYVFGTCKIETSSEGPKSDDWSVLACRKKAMIRGADGVYRWTLGH